MKELVATAPVEFDDVIQSVTNLTAVVEGGADEVRELIPIILDISAATGIAVQDTTSQIIRMYSAGAASADLFRERGVTAALGFQAGVSVSNEETIRRIVEQWEDGTGKFVGAIDSLRDTWDARVGEMSDAWTLFSEQVGKFFIEDEQVQGFMDTITNKLGEMTEGMRILMDSGITVTDLLSGLFSTVSTDAIRAKTEIDNMNIALAEQAGLVVDLGTIVVKGGKTQEQVDKARIKSLNSLKTAFIDFLDTGAQVSKDLAVGLQVIRSAEALIDTHKAAARALAEHPYPFSLAIAALVTAKGLAEVAAINSVKFAQGTDTVPALLTPGEAVIPRTFADALRAGDITIGGPEADRFGGVPGGGVTIIVEQANLTSDQDVVETAEMLGREFENSIRTGRSV